MLIRTTISQNLRTPRKFFLVVLVLVLDWVSGLDYEDEDDDEDDSVAAAPR